MFTSLVSVNHSVLSDCCPIAAINPIDGIVVQPIQRGKRFAIELFGFENRIHDSNNKACFCTAPGVGAHGSYGQGKGAGRRWYYYGDPGNAGTYVDTVPVKGRLNYTSGNEPAMAMWGAVDEMASQVEATWREVWNS